MPDLTTNDSPIRIVRWIARPGDTVERGQPLLEAETDKATMEVESAVSGRLDQVLCEADEEVSVGQVIAVFEIAETTPADPPRDSCHGRPGRRRHRPWRSGRCALPADGGSPPQPAGEPRRHVCAQPRRSRLRRRLPSASLATERRAAHGRQAVAGEQADDPALLPADELQRVGDRGPPQGRRTA